MAKRQEDTVNKLMKESHLLPNSGVIPSDPSEATGLRWGPLVRCVYCSRWYRGPDVPAHGPPGYEAKPCGFQLNLPCVK